MKKFKVGSVEVSIKIKEATEDYGKESTVYFDIVLKNLNTEKTLDYIDYAYFDLIEMLDELEKEQLEELVLKRILSDIGSDIDIVNHQHEKVTFQDIVEVTGQDWVDELKIVQKLSR